MKYLSTIILLFSVLAIMVGAAFYLSNRFNLYSPIISRKIWLAGIAFTFVTIIIGVIVFPTTAHPIGKTIYILGGIISSALIFILLAVIVSDLLNLILNFNNNTRAVISIALALFLGVYGIWSSFSIQIKTITIPIKGLESEINALHLTDVHLGNFRGKNQIARIVEKINELKPDVIFNTGDMFDSKAHFGEKMDVLEPLNNLTIPHYFVYGNHDEHVDEKKVIDLMRKANAKVLLNEVTSFRELQIVGLNNMAVDRDTFDPHVNPSAPTIQETIELLEIHPDRPTVVLHHRPEGVKYMYKKGADLLLAGHTHAGQLFPFTFLAKNMFTYNRGLYNFEEMVIYVSEGIGTIFSPVRLATRSEMTLIKLVPKN